MRQPHEETAKSIPCKIHFIFQTRKDCNEIHYPISKWPPHFVLKLNLAEFQMYEGIFRLLSELLVPDGHQPTLFYVNEV